MVDPPAASSEHRLEYFEIASPAERRPTNDISKMATVVVFAMLPICSISMLWVHSSNYLSETNRQVRGIYVHISCFAQKISSSMKLHLNAGAFSSLVPPCLLVPLKPIFLHTCVVRIQQQSLQKANSRKGTNVTAERGKRYIDGVVWWKGCPSLQYIDSC